MSPILAEFPEIITFLSDEYYFPWDTISHINIKTDNSLDGDMSYYEKVSECTQIYHNPRHVSTPMVVLRYDIDALYMRACMA